MNKMTIFVSTLLICASGACADEGDLGWISKDAKFAIIGEEAEKSMISFTTLDNKYYNAGKDDAYALSLQPSADAGVTIDLGNEQLVRSVIVRNRSNSANQAELTLSISSDAKTWKTMWTADEAGYAWDAELPEGTKARYLKLDRGGRAADKPFELKWVKAYNRTNPYNEQELYRLRYEGVKGNWVRSSKPLPTWFNRGTGLGLFMHFAPASAKYASGVGWCVWKNRAITHNGELLWPQDKYRDVLGKLFNPQNYDPDKWMAPAKDAGFDYAVLTTRHCSGYTLWPSAVNSTGGWGTGSHMGGRDLLKPYVEACRKHDVKVGFYCIPSDWTYNPDWWPYRGFPYTSKNFEAKSGYVKPPEWTQEKVQAVMDRYLKENVFVVIDELMSRYGTVDLMWFDGFAWPASQERSGKGLDIKGDEMEALIRKHQPDIVINPRYNIWGGYSDIGQYKGFENHFPEARPSDPWEFCVSIRGGWGCNNADNPQAGRPTVWVLSDLAKCRSWGGNYLPNIGPFPDGTMPSYYYGLCEELTGWMKHSREAVEDINGGPWPEQSNVPVTTRNNGKTWYLFGWPQTDQHTYDEKDVTDKEKYQNPLKYVYNPKAKTIIVTDVNKPQKATLLHNGDALNVEYRDRTLTITVPAEQTTKLVDVVKVEW